MADGEEEAEDDAEEQHRVGSNRVHPVPAPSNVKKLREMFRDGVPESWSEPQTQWEEGGSPAPLLLVEPQQHQPRVELVAASQAYALSCCGLRSPEPLSIAVSLASAAKAEKLLETAPPGSCLLRVEEVARSLWLSLKLRCLVRHHQLLPATLQPSIESASAPSTSRHSQVEKLATRLVLPTSLVRRVRRWPMRAGFLNRLSKFFSELARCPHFVEYALEALSLADELVERPFLVCLSGEDLCLCKLSSAGLPHTMRLFINWQAEKLMVGTGKSVRSLSEALVRLMGTTESKSNALETDAEPFWQTPQIPQAQMREIAALMLLRSLHPTMQRQGLKQLVELLTQDNKTSASWAGQACSALLTLVLAGGSIGVEAVQAVQLLLKDSPATVLESTQAMLRTAVLSKTVSVSLYQLLLDAVEQSADSKLSLDVDVLLEHYKAIKLDASHACSGIAECDERQGVPSNRKNTEAVQRLEDSQQVIELPGSARQTDSRPRVHSIAQGDAGSNSYAATVALLRRSAPYQAKILLLKLLNNANCPSQASRALHKLMQDCSSCLLLQELPEQDQLFLSLYKVIHHLGLEGHMAECTESITAIGHGPEALQMLAGYARSQPVGDMLSLCKAVMQIGSTLTGAFSDVHAHPTSRQLLAATSWLQALAACLLHSNDSATDTACLEKLSSSGALEMAVSCTQQLCASVDASAFRPTRQLHLLFWWQQLAQLLSRLAHSLPMSAIDVYWHKFSAILGSDANKYFTSTSASAQSQHHFSKLLELVCLQPRCPFMNDIAFMRQTAALLVSQFKTLYIEGSSKSLMSCSRLCHVLTSVVSASDVCAEALYGRDLLPFLTTEISSEYDMFKKSVSRSASISSVDHSPSKDRVSAKSSGGSAVGQVAAAHPNKVPSLRLSALGDQRASSAVSSGPPSKPSRLFEQESAGYQPGCNTQNGFFDLNEQVDAEEAEELSSEYIIGKPASAQSRTGPLVEQTRSVDRTATGAARSDRSASSSSRLHVPKLALGRCSFASTKSGFSSPANQSVVLALALEAEGLTSQYRLHHHVYSIASLHVSLLYLMLTMLLTPRGSLDRRHSDSFPMQRGKPSTLLHLHHHMNHPANAAVVQQLVAMVADSANAGLKRLLKLLVCSQFDLLIYNNKQHIARGAYAQVFKVELADSVAALKVVDLPSSGHDRCTVHDVYREIHILEELREEQCVSRLIDYGVDRDSCYVVMAYYPASVRTWRVAQPEPFEQYIVLYLRVYQQVLNAAAKLEEHSIIHYDLKCDNILLSRHDTVSMEDFWHPTSAFPPFNVCISDFGESKLSAPSDAFTIRDRGTDFIKSPEMLTVHSVQSKLLHEDQSAQVTGADKACDAWSLTCLLFELITGKYLFQEDDWVRFYVRVTDPAQELLVPERRAMLAEHPHILGFLDWGLIRDPKLRPSIPELKERFVTVLDTYTTEADQTALSLLYSSNAQA